MEELTAPHPFSMLSQKEVKPLSEILLPFKVIFPVTVEGSVNKLNYRFPAGLEVSLEYPVWEAINHSTYAKYLT